MSGFPQTSVPPTIPGSASLNSALINNLKIQNLIGPTGSIPSEPVESIQYNDNGSFGGTEDLRWVSELGYSQQGPKLVGSGADGLATQGFGVSLYGDTLAIGGPSDEGTIGATWIFTRSNGVWTQQGGKLIGTGAVGVSGAGQGLDVSLYGDTLAVGGPADDNGIGAVWIFTRSNGVWTQQGNKLVGTGVEPPIGGMSFQGINVSLYGDTLAVGGYSDDGDVGATWVFTRSNGVWTQQGNKLVGTGFVGTPGQGIRVSLYEDTLAVGGIGDNTATGATWVFTRSNGVWTQQGSKLLGTGSIGQAGQGSSVSLYKDMLTVGGFGDDNNTGAVWTYTRSNGTWTQQGSKLVGSSEISIGFGIGNSLYEDTLVVGETSSELSVGGTIVYTRLNNTWVQQGEKLVGTGSDGPANQGLSISLYEDTYVVFGRDGFDGFSESIGAVWVFTYGENGYLSTNEIITEQINVEVIKGESNVTFASPIILPRYSQDELDKIPEPQVGMFCFNLDTSALTYYDGDAWV